MALDRNRTHDLPLGSKRTPLRQTGRQEPIKCTFFPIFHGLVKKLFQGLGWNVLAWEMLIGILSLKRFGFNVERKRIAEERSLETLMRNVSSAKFGRLLVLNKSEINPLKIIKCIHLLST